MVTQQDIDEMEEEIERCDEPDCNTCRKLREIIIKKHQEKNELRMKKIKW